MKTLKVLFPAILAILLISSVSAVVFDTEWYDGSQSITITNGQSVSLNVNGVSANPPTTIYIDVIGSGNLFTDHVSDHSFENSYTITPSMYSNPGTYNIEVTADDAAHYGYGPLTLTLHVNPAPAPINNPPTINSIPNQNVTENASYSYTVSATDPEGDSLIYSLVTAPTWLSINPATGAISGTAPLVNSDTNYQITVGVSDSVNPIVTASYTLTVIDVPSSSDSVPPVITILGSNPATVQVFSLYVDAGATATDNVDGNLTSSIAVSGAVNTGTIGTYYVNYTVSDFSGNTATAARIVNIIDSISPNITLLGSDPQVIVQGTNYTEFGAAATDNYDGNLTASIIINSSSVNVSAAGTYNVTYFVSDSSGNNATATRTVLVLSSPDTTSPSVQFVSSTPSDGSTRNVDSIPIQIAASDSESGLKNITVYLYDSSGNLAGIASSLFSPFITSFAGLSDGTYALNATAYDNAGNMASTSTRRIKIDTSSSGSSSSSHASGYSYSDVYTPQYQEQSNKTPPGISLGSQNQNKVGNANLLWFSLVALLVLIIAITLILLARRRK